MLIVGHIGGHIGFHRDGFVLQVN